MEMGGGIGFSKTTRDADTRRWLNENFARLPLDDKSQLLRYSLRWGLLGRCVKNMKRFKVTPASLCEKLRKSMEGLPPPRIEDPLADVGIWVKREIFVEDIISLGVLPSKRDANKLFSALDPHKKNFLPTYEIASIFNVFFSVLWATPWTNANSEGDLQGIEGAKTDENKFSAETSEEGSSSSTSSVVVVMKSKGDAASAEQITEAIVSAACVQLDLGQTSALPQTVVESCMLCICCSRQAEVDMLSLFSLIFNAIKGFNVLLPSNLGTGSIKCISLNEIYAAVKTVIHLKKHIEKEWAEASYAASVGSSTRD